MVGVLVLFGKGDQLAARSDLILSAAVLFADGWWKVRKVFSLSKEALEFVGFVGALIAIFLATIMLLSEIGGIPQLTSIIGSSRFFYLQATIEVAAVSYALLVRAKVFQYEDWRRDAFLELSERVRKIEATEKSSGK